MKDNNMNVILGIIFIVFGFIFCLAPESVFASIVMVAGMLVIVFGLLRLLGSMNGEDSYKAYSIVTAILCIVFGALLIVYRDSTIKIIAELIGVWLLLSGISSVLIMLKSNMKGKILIKPIVKIVIGIVALLIPIIPISFAGIVIGVILILTGISILTTKKEEEVIYKVKIKK